MSHFLFSKLIEYKDGVQMNLIGDLAIDLTSTHVARLNQLNRWSTIIIYTSRQMLPGTCVGRSPVK
jgi:hypothetical protein